MLPLEKNRSIYSLQPISFLFGKIDFCLWLLFSRNKKEQHGNTIKILRSSCTHCISSTIAPHPGTTGTLAPRMDKQKYYSPTWNAYSATSTIAPAVNATTPTVL